MSILQSRDSSPSSTSSSLEQKLIHLLLVRVHSSGYRAGEEAGFEKGILLTQELAHIDKTLINVKAIGSLSEPSYYRYGLESIGIEKIFPGIVEQRETHHAGTLLQEPERVVLRDEVFSLRGESYNVNHMHSILVKGPNPNGRYDIEFEYGGEKESYLGRLYVPWETVAIEGFMEEEIDSLKQQFEDSPCGVNIVAFSK